MKWTLLVFCVVGLLFTVPAEDRGFNCPTCKGDLNCDGVVDDTDLDIVLACWGSEPKGACAAADINGDGQIGSADLAIVIAAWGPCP